MNESSTGGPTTTSIISEVYAEITVCLDPQCRPIRLTATWNKIEVVNVIGGTGNCGEGSVHKGSQATRICRSFCVEPCDVIRFHAEQPCIPLDGCAPNKLGYSFDVESCTGTCDETNSIATSSPISNQQNYEQYNEQYYSNQIISIFPNPVNDIFQITNLDPLKNYQTTRIINSAGIVVYSKNISGEYQVSIDANSFSKGIYLVEIMDIQGNRVVKKISKL